MRAVGAGGSWCRASGQGVQVAIWRHRQARHLHGATAVTSWSWQVGWRGRGRARVADNLAYECVVMAGVISGHGRL